MSQTPYRVVIAEDEALIRLDLKEMLEEPGQEAYVVVGEASDGGTAVKLAEDLRPDLVIMDIKMPVLDGISAAEQITSRALAPVVILTAFSQRELIQRASSAGALAYLVKPFSRADLIPAMEIAVTRFAELTGLQTEVRNLRERLEMRKLLDRAKGVLQTTYQMTEPQAFRWIQKTSMDRRMTMRALAQQVIESGAGPDQPPSGQPPTGQPSATQPSAAQSAKAGTAEPKPAKPSGSKPAEAETAEPKPKKPSGATSSGATPSGATPSGARPAPGAPKPSAPRSPVPKPPVPKPPPAHPPTPKPPAEG